MLDLVVIGIVILALVNSNSGMAKTFRLSKNLEFHLHYLLAYHLFFSCFFTWYILNYGGDSIGYWRMNMQQVFIKGEETWFSYFGQGTKFILWITYIPSKLLGLSYLTGNILFGALGFIGIRYIYVMTAELFPTNYDVFGVPLFPAVFYFLNLHFWSSGVGKDAISFWGIAWFLFAIQKYQSRWSQAIIALFFVYMARPHMGQALIGGASLAIFLGSDVKFGYKIALGSLAVIAGIWLLPYTLEELRLEELSIESLGSLANSKVGNLNDSHVGSGFDLQSYPWPFKLFTYLYRPLFFDSHNFVSFFSSFENLLYFYLSFFIYRNWTPEAIRDMPLFIKAGMLTFIPVTLAFMNALSNTGIIMRMKNMTMIYFLLFCFFLIVYKKHMKSQEILKRFVYFESRDSIKKSKQKIAEKL